MVTTNAPIITLRDVRFTYDGGATWALDGVSLDIRCGERICLTGPNGSGKSTLSRVIAGLVAPDEGYVVLSGNVVFDESGAHADEYRTARCGIGAVFQHPEDQIVTTVTEDDVAFGPENLAIEHDEIGLRISGSLDAVDMSDYRASDPTRMSGGQQQRIAIAGMLAMDSDVLVLDEPTNDLDIDSLEMLEQTLATYPGTIILVSHDRRFLDNVVTEVLAPEGNGLWREYVGGYSDWLQQRPEPVEPAAPAAPQPKAAAKSRPRDNKIRMSYKETQELERLPKLIEDLEAEQAALMEAMSAPDYHTKSVEELRKDAERAKAIEDEIASSYERWEALEEKRQLAENQ